MSQNPENLFYWIYILENEEKMNAAIALIAK